MTKAHNAALNRLLKTNFGPYELFAWDGRGGKFPNVYVIAAKQLVGKAKAVVAPYGSAAPLFLRAGVVQIAAVPENRKCRFQVVLEICTISMV